jgi:hypothetical protein
MPKKPRLGSEKNPILVSDDDFGDPNRVRPRNKRKVLARPSDLFESSESEGETGPNTPRNPRAFVDEKSDEKNPIAAAASGQSGSTKDHPVAAFAAAASGQSGSTKKQGRNRTKYRAVLSGRIQKPSELRVIPVENLVTIDSTEPIQLFVKYRASFPSLALRKPAKITWKDENGNELRSGRSDNLYGAYELNGTSTFRLNWYNFGNWFFFDQNPRRTYYGIDEEGLRKVAPKVTDEYLDALEKYDNGTYGGNQTPTYKLDSHPFDVTNKIIETTMPDGHIFRRRERIQSGERAAEIISFPVNR